MITHFGGETKQAANQLAYRLRAAGVGVYVAFARAKRSMKSQMREANKRDVAFTLIMGQDEMENGVVQVRPMAGGEQVAVSQDELAAWLTAEFNKQ
jgi:histidyl-tRNA synthetase